jgi:hypothetical protein
LQRRLGKLLAEQRLRDPEGSKPLADAGRTDEQKSARQPPALQTASKPVEHGVMSNNWR